MQILGDRLTEERKRLRLTQQALAEACGVTGRSQSNYEKGDRQPDAIYLAALAAVGADVLYVLTGVRGGIVMTPEESALLDNYRHSPPAAQKALKTTSDLLAQRDCPGGAAESA